MPLTTCPECGRSVAAKADKCPGCGARLRSSLLRKGATCGCLLVLLPIFVIVALWVIGRA